MTQKTPHFHLHGDSADLLQAYADCLEDAAARLADDFALENVLSLPFDVYLCAGVDDYVRLTGKRKEDYQDWMVGWSDLSARRICLLPSAVSREEARKIAVHEAVHAVLDDACGAAETEAWLAEGAAVLYAGQTNLACVSLTDYPRVSDIAGPTVNGDAPDCFYDHGGYDYAGIYVSHLLRRFGPELFLRAYRNEVNVLSLLDEAFERDAIHAWVNQTEQPLSPLFDNHDGRIRYEPLLLERPDLNGIPDRPLPPGYRFVFFQPGDRDSWIAIEQSAKELTDYAQGLSVWADYYRKQEALLPRRMLFIENEAGEKVATATAYYDVQGVDDASIGYVHWVAVRRDHQGRGLARPLIARTLTLLRELGYTHVKIHTQTTTWLACGLYMDFGFRPTAQSAKENAVGWQIVKALTRHSALEAVAPADIEAILAPAR